MNTSKLFLTAPPRRGMLTGSILLNANGGKPFVFNEGMSYMYDELRYGNIPSQANAERLLADLKAGRAVPHPISDPGYEQRLEDIIAGRSVDPACFGIPSADGCEKDPMSIGPNLNWTSDPWYRRFIKSCAFR